MLNFKRALQYLLRTKCLSLTLGVLSLACSHKLLAQPVAWYRLDESTGNEAIDSSGCEYNATYINSPTLGAAGVTNTGASFIADDGTFDRVDIPRETIHGATTVSIAWWMKTSKTGAQSILSGARASQANAFLLFFSSHTIFNFYVDGPSRSITIPSIATDEWLHFVLTYDHTTGIGELFIDGDSVGTTAHTVSTASIQIDDGGLVLGEEQDSVGGGFVASQSFEGTLDEVVIYNTVLSTSEVENLYLEGPRTKKLLLITNSASLTSQESLRKQTFESWGYKVETIVDSETQENYDIALVEKDVAFVSQDVLSTDVGYKLRETTVGVVTSEGWLDDELGFSTSNPYTSSQTRIAVIDNSHEVSAGMSVGQVAIFSSSQNRVLMYGAEAGGIQVLATSSSGDTVLAVLEPGATLANSYNSNNLAAGKRVRLPWGDSSFNFSALNSTGLDLLERALDWASIKGNSTGLLLHLRLDETTGTIATDSSGYGNDGSYINSPAIGVNAIRRKGTEFTSNDQYVRVPTSASLDTLGEGDSDFTIAFWVKPNALTGGWRPLFHKGDSNNTRGPGLWLRPSVNRIHYRVSTTHSFNEGNDTTGSLELDQWTHVLLLKSGSTLEFYLNGKFDESSNLVGTSVGNTGGLYIGDSPWYGTTDCSMDDIRIYDRAISTSEIADVYGLVGHWKLDETSGSTAYDSSGMGNDGTHNGGVTVNVPGSDNDELSVAAEYDGVDEETELQSLKYNFSEGFAASMWVKPTQVLSSNYYAFFDLANGTNRDEIWVGWVSPSVGFQLYMTDNMDGSSLRTIEDNQDISANSWVHFIAMINEDGDATLYRDGVETKTGFNTSLPRSVSRSSNLIANSVWNNENLPAAMQDIRLYNRPLTDAEIQELSGADPTNGLRIMSWTEVANP